MNTKNEDFFSKLSKFFDIFLVSVFNWELFWFSSNSLKKYANLAKFSLKRSDLIDFWRQNDNSGNDVLSWLQTQKSLVWTFIWILDFMSGNLDLLPWVFIFGPLLIGWTFGPLLTDLDLWMCHFGPEYLDLFRPLLFIMKGEFSCWKNRNELKKMKILLNNAKYTKVNDDKVDVNDKEQNGRLLTLILCILLIICCSSWTITVYIAAKAPNDTLW